MTKNRVELSDYDHSLVAEIKISYRGSTPPEIVISNSSDAFGYLFGLFDQDTISLKEDFFLLLLNRRQRPLGWLKLSSGGMAGTVVDIRLIFAIALQASAHSIILCHNHPSGNLTPSSQDVDLTRRAVQAGSVLEIKVMDHLIVSPQADYYSLADNGQI